MKPNNVPDTRKAQVAPAQRRKLLATRFGGRESAPATLALGSGAKLAPK